MAQIVTITNPLTGQPAQVDQLEHTAQEIDDGIGFESTDYPGCYYRMVDGVTEWVNPPMRFWGTDANGNQINEYRTIERHLGKPVYLKRIKIDDLPNASQLEIPNVITSVDTLFDLNFICVDSAGGISCYPPFYSTSVAARAWVRSTGELIIKTFSDLSSNSAIVTLKYTKTTD